MKTWEMIRELAENPKKKFIRTSTEGMYYVDDEGWVVCFHSFVGSYKLDINEEWEEYKERKEVSVQEALTELHNEKVRVLYELDGTLWEMGKLMNRVDIAAILRGKWYIEEK